MKKRRGFRFSIEGRPAWSLYPLHSPSPFCDLIKHTREGIARCIKSDQEASRVVLRTKKPLIYECHAGLIDGIIPVLIEGEPVAFLVFGQFLMEQPSEEKFQQVWEKIANLGVPYEELREAFFNLPVVPSRYVKSLAQGIFEALREAFRSISFLASGERKQVLDADAKIWLAQQEWQILRLSQEERELLSLFYWASREAILEYWSKWVKEKLQTFEEAPRETKSRIWETLASLLSHLRIFRPSPRINLLEFYSHYISLMRGCNSQEQMEEILEWIMNDLLLIRGDAKYRASIVERAKKYILQNYSSEDLRLKEVAKALHVSPYYLSHLFKSSEGISVGKYIKDIRIARARELLQTSDLSIIDIASEVGYSDPAYFSKIFKRETGLSPSQYRREIKQNITS